MKKCIVWKRRKTSALSYFSSLSVTIQRKSCHQDSKVHFKDLTDIYFKIQGIYDKKGSANLAQDQRVDVTSPNG